MALPFSGGFNRREMLRFGSVAGLSMAELFRLQHASGAVPASKKEINCIFIFILGGMSHHDLWDLKPDAPDEIRGDFDPISTNVPGIQISEILPQISKVTDKLALLRGMTHTDADHGRGTHTMMTGVKPGAGDFNVGRDNNVHPSLGSMVAKMSQADSSLPSYISVPTFLRSGGANFLGASCDPFVIESDPAAPEFSVRDISLPANVALARSRRRQAALQQINQLESGVERASKGVKSLDVFYQKAYNLMTSVKAKEAFDIHRESDATRQRYGMTSIGQCCLLARRIVEAGGRFVTVEDGNWDTHRKNTMSLRELLVPAFDQAIPALLGDLSDRGLLDSTLVVISTEFGRTPRINVLAGRDHWPQAFTICMAGAELKTGQVIGQTDKQGAYVMDRPITPQDFTATILSKLGIDPNTVLHTEVGRPIQLVSGGKPVKELS